MKKLPSDCVRGAISVVAILLFLLTAGCSGVGEAMAVSDLQRDSGSSGSHQLWGYYEFRADPASGTLDVVPLRGAEMHLNALSFLEPPPLVHLTLDSIEFNGDIIEADIGLRHPFLGLNEFTGFDVCGILISHGSNGGYADSSLLFPGDDDTRLLNPDGYSRWWNPVEFPVNEGTIFSYNDGLLGAPYSVAQYNATVNGYKYFCDGLDPDDAIYVVPLSKRGMFGAGQKNVRHYTIKIGAGGLKFNYAVDACWKFPMGTEPYVVPDDFGPNANRPEAWRVSVTELENTLWNDGSNNGGDLRLRVDVYDWFNAGLNMVNVESPGNFTPEISTTLVGSGEGYSTYEIEIFDATPSEGAINLLISVESEIVGYGNILPGKPVTAYFMDTTAVAGKAPLGWAITWGGNGRDTSSGVTVDGTGNIYVTGEFVHTVDFDPGPGEDWHTSNDVYDAFLSKFDPSGSILWAKTWGGSGDMSFDAGGDVAVDISGSVYVTGWFNGSVDFDPGPGEDWHNSNGELDAYLCKFDSSGGFLWAKTWGGDGFDHAIGVTVDTLENVYVTGAFMDAVDFDPGPGEDWHFSTGAGDAFLSKFDSSGGFQWAKTWDYVIGRDIVADISGNVYMTGDFYETVDFDPGPGEDWHFATGDGDAFLSKFDSAGAFLWVKTWGGSKKDRGRGVSVDIPGNIYVIGDFGSIVDFDPGPGIEERLCNGDEDIFLSKIDSSGVFLWVSTWGGNFTYWSERGFGVAADISGNVYATGRFQSTADLDPGPGEDWHIASGLNDVFLSKFDSSGGFLWARTWGGSAFDWGIDVAADASCNVYVTGKFATTVDFDPSPGENWHSSNGNRDIFLSKFSPEGSW